MIEKLLKDFLEKQKSEVQKSEVQNGKMKTIKFRGKDIETGKFIYGDLIHYCNKVYVDDVLVDPKTVAQLVGYDKNKKDIYSDDMIYLCKLGAYYYAENFFKIEDIGKKFDNVELVEREKK